MSLSNDAGQRQRWIAKSRQLIGAIEDRRREITVAVRGKPPTNIMIKLAESDVHLAVAQTELAEAISRMAAWS